MDWNIDMTKKKTRASNYVALPPPPPVNQEPPELLDVHSLARILGTTSTAVYTAHSRREIPADCVVKIGSRLRFRSDRVAAWIDSCTVQIKEAA